MARLGNVSGLLISYEEAFRGRIGEKERRAHAKALLKAMDFCRERGQFYRIELALKAPNLPMDVYHAGCRHLGEVGEFEILHSLSEDEEVAKPARALARALARKSRAYGVELPAPVASLPGKRRAGGQNKSRPGAPGGRGNVGPREPPRPVPFARIVVCKK